jgi:dTDP-4-amino-4,6-dideoxygalactose transaminase
MADSQDSKKILPWMDLKRQYEGMKHEILKGAEEVLSSGIYILGNNVKNFEKEFAAYCGAKHCIGVANGTEALQLSLRAIGISPGDEVITVPNTAVPTVVAIVEANAKPVLVDVDPNTHNMDPSKLEKTITKKTKAIIPVHLFGNPADMKEINRIAAKHNIVVIEDACQAHGAEIDGKRTGTLAFASCFSFYPTKNLGAYGDAGAIVTDDDDFAEKIRMLRTYGEVEKYKNKIEGINSRLDELQAKLLSIKLKHLDSWVNRRRELAKHYHKLLQGVKEVSYPVELSGAKHSYHLFVIRTSKRDELQQYLKEKGILCGIHYPLPIHWQEAYARLGYKKGSFPVAEKYSQEILSLPMFPELTEKEVERVCDAIKSFFRGGRK